MKRYFCTYFNKDYYIYGMTMFQSLKTTGIDMKVFVLCLDDILFEHLQGCDEALVPIRLADLEKFDPETAACKNNRSMVEYFFTLSPALPLYLMSRFPEIDILAYVDSDFYFYSTPEPIWEELGDKATLIFEHDFSCNAVENLGNGRFNVGFQLYRNDVNGKKILSWWREKCIEWCYDRVEPERFADQKYLDRWPVLFPADVVIAEKTRGAGLAPWNIATHTICIHKGKIFSDDKQLIFFHFQNCKLVTPHLVYFPPLWNILSSWKIENFLFGNYYHALKKQLKSSPVSANRIGARDTATWDRIFNRNWHLQKMPSVVSYWGHIILGIWRFHDFRPWGLRFFSYRRFL